VTVMSLALIFYLVTTFKYKKVRQVVALHHAKAESESDALANDINQKKYYKLMNEVPMTDDRSAEGKYNKGIKYYLSKVQYLIPGNQE
jgi:type I restriction enzyme R subunit